MLRILMSPCDYIGTENHEELIASLELDLQCHHERMYIDADKKPQEKKRNFDAESAETRSIDLSIKKRKLDAPSAQMSSVKIDKPHCSEDQRFM